MSGLGDGSLVDVGLLAQPIVFVTGGQLDGGHSSLAPGLSVTALGSLHDSVGSDGGTGNAVDLSRACSHQLFTQLVGSSSAVGSGLAGGIDHNVCHSAVGEGHGDLDGRRDALSSTLIGAGDVGAGCTGSSGGRAGSIAGSQSTGFRVWALMPGLDSVLFVESVPFYLLRCARLYDLPFAIGCMVFVCRRFAPLFDRTEQLARELDARVAERTKELTAETEARKSMMLNIFHDLRSPLFAASIRAASKDAWRITIRQ